MVHLNAISAPNFASPAQTPEISHQPKVLFGQKSDIFTEQDPHQALKQQMWDLLGPKEHWQSKGRMLGLCTGLQHLGVKNIDGKDSSAKWQAKNNAFKIRRAFREELECHEHVFQDLGKKPQFKQFADFIQTLQGLLKENDTEKLTAIANTAGEILKKKGAQPLSARVYGSCYALFWQDNHLIALHGIGLPRN
ncbi:MAG TPA: hypothetical protein V6C52_04370 [Coleofasciculaceae cyanobacterium]|jgi:hypothetical protein